MQKQKWDSSLTGKSILLKLAMFQNCFILRHEKGKNAPGKEVGGGGGGLEPPTFALIQHPRRFTPVLLISTTL